MATTKREKKIMLASMGKTKEGNPTGTFYTTYKNKTNSPDKLLLKKYDPRAWNPKTQRNGMHVDFKEKKIPK